MFLHPLGCTLGRRLHQWYLFNSVGQPLEYAVALSHLIFAGVLDRHPDLQLLAAHGGGYLPAFLGRTDHAWEVRPDARTCERPPSSYMSNLYFDSCVHSADRLRELVRTIGHERVVLGSDQPFDMGVDDVVDQMRAARLGPEAERAIAVDNPRRLGLVPPSHSHHRPSPQEST